VGAVIRALLILAALTFPARADVVLDKVVVPSVVEWTGSHWEHGPTLYVVVVGDPYDPDCPERYVSVSLKDFADATVGGWWYAGE
jgi:hypothetical protein